MEVISRSTGEDFASRGLSSDRIRVVYVGIDREQYSPDNRVPKAERPTFLALGRVRKYKRLDLVVDAVVDLARTRHPELTLTVSGTGNYLEALQQHVRKLDAGDVVRFTGLVTEEEKVRLYREAWALVVTSPKEGWGLTCLEAEACGTPVIASDSPGLREAVRDGKTGLLVPHGRREELTATMDRFLSDEALRGELRAGALEFARTFSWDRAARETMDLVEETIGDWEVA
jgi:glycosyltransferase involved in cell wall biosynthesis